MRILACPKGELEGNACQFALYHEIEKGEHIVDNYLDVNLFRHKYEIFHIHWPESFIIGKSMLKTYYKMIKLLFQIVVMKLKKTKIVWTCHNLSSHSKKYPVLENVFMSIFSKLISGFISPLNSSILEIEQKYPTLKKKHRTVVYTGHYIDLYKNDISRKDARKQLKISEDKVILGFVGNIDYYKGILDLLHAFSNTKDNNLVLLIAGKSKDKELINIINEFLTLDGRIHFFEGYIANDNIQLFMNTIDLLILPFKEINNSGSVFLGLSFNKIVLVPDIPQFREIKENIGKDFIQLYRNSLNENVINEYVSNYKQNTYKIHPDFSNLHYENLGNSTLCFFNNLLLKKN